MTQTKNSQEISHKALSIQVSLNGLSFCILNTASNTIEVIKQSAFEKKLTPFGLLDAIKHLFNTQEALHDTFNNVQLIHVNELSTLVPAALFNEDVVADYLKLNSKILKSDFVTFDDIKINETVNVYVPYVNVNNFIFDHYGDFTYRHYSTVLIEEILKQEKNADSSKLYIHVNPTHFEIIATKAGALTLYNTFEYQTAEDFIYYVLFTAEQLSLNPESIETVLLGAITKNDALYNILYKYVRHVSFIQQNDAFNYADTITNNQSNFTLIHSLKCE
ncbi:DUF3822 family protein [Lacinutrix chionoecetis]